ncbi:hypothetical protein [Streptomyces sp. NPDC086838]|uniref:hypothetical protein n=1 Tax=Streptomyces sp. NPDC086838 TaxID=3365762 RepID=UPI00381B29EC
MDWSVGAPPLLEGSARCSPLCDGCARPGLRVAELLVPLKRTVSLDEEWMSSVSCCE